MTLLDCDIVSFKDSFTQHLKYPLMLSIPCTVKSPWIPISDMTVKVDVRVENDRVEIILHVFMDLLQCLAATTFWFWYCIFHI